MTDFSKLEIRDTSTLAWQIKVSSAFEHWVKESNGKIEARKYQLSPAIEDGDIQKAQFLAKLNFEPFEGALPDMIQVSDKLNPDEFIQEILAHAGEGGAYSQPPDVKIRDRSAWYSIAGFMDVYPQKDSDKQKEQMRSFFWYHLTVESDWFYQIAWDACFICLDKNGEQLTILAVTDTD